MQQQSVATYLSAEERKLLKRKSKCSTYPLYTIFRTEKTICTFTHLQKYLNFDGNITITSILRHPDFEAGLEFTFSQDEYWFDKSFIWYSSSPSLKKEINNLGIQTIVPEDTRELLDQILDYQGSIYIKKIGIYVQSQSYINLLVNRSNLPILTKVDSNTDELEQKLSLLANHKRSLGLVVSSNEQETSANAYNLRISKRICLPSDTVIALNLDIIPLPKNSNKKIKNLMLPHILNSIEDKSLNFILDNFGWEFKQNTSPKSRRIVDQQLPVLYLVVKAIENQLSNHHLLGFVLDVCVSKSQRIRHSKSNPNDCILFQELLDLAQFYRTDYHLRFLERGISIDMLKKEPSKHPHHYPDNSNKRQVKVYYKRSNETISFDKYKVPLLEWQGFSSKTFDKEKKISNFANVDENLSFANLSFKKYVFILCRYNDSYLFRKLSDLIPAFFEHENIFLGRN